MRILLKIVAAFALLIAVAYGFDDLYVRLRHEPYADVRIDRILAVSQKFNKIDYERTDPITEKCVYSLFPHAGYSPCWYLMRHTSQIIEIG
jgi:hypothetical protein